MLEYFISIELTKQELARKLPEQKLTFFKLSAPELVASMSGESESNIRYQTSVEIKIRLLFEHAKSMEPSLVFIDEIDVISPKRDNVQKEMERRIVAQLLSCFDGIFVCCEI